MAYCSGPTCSFPYFLIKTTCSFWNFCAKITCSFMKRLLILNQENCMLKRKIENTLLDWKNNRKTALLITGARQIGKTYSIMRFIKYNFKHSIVINFAERLDLIDTFIKIKNPTDLIIRLSLIDGENLVEKETIIFFDEIQLFYKRREELLKNNSMFEYLDLLTAMKSMSIEGKYRFILSGSLLGVNLNNIVLNPLGYMDVIKMYPLDFEEYLWSKGVGDNAIAYIKKCFNEMAPVDEDINKQFLNYFREYVLIGGLPEAVETFKKTKNLKLVNNIQSQIINNNLNDITTYVNDKKEKLRINDIYKAIPSELNNKNKRFMSSHIFDNTSLKKGKLEDDFLWLTNAYLSLPVYNVSEPVIPLQLSSQRKTMKLFMNDTGLLISCLMDTGIREKLLNNEKEINYGAPYENVCAQELYAHGFNDKLFYYNSKKHGEVDFIIEYKNDVLPLEIKSGKPNQMMIYNHTALNNIKKLYDIQKSYVFGESNVAKEKDNVIQFPIYMIMFMTKD